MPLYFYLFIAIFILTGCGSTPNKQRNASTNQLASNVFDLDTSDMNSEQIAWLNKIKAFQIADVENVKTPYAAVVSELDEWPTDTYCSDEHIQTMRRGLLLNPSSIASLVLQNYCAEQNGDKAVFEQTSVDIANVADILLRTGTGDTPEHAFVIRDLFEGQIILQWAGLDAFDMELVRLTQRTLLRIHTFDPQTNQYVPYYADNSDFILQNIRAISGLHPSSQDLAKMLADGLLNVKAEPAINWQNKQWLRTNQSNKVMETFDQQAEHSAVATLIFAQALFNLGLHDELDNYLDTIITLSEQGFVDASAFVGQVLLSSQDELDTKDAANLFVVNADAIGTNETTRIWLEQFLSEPDPSPYFSALIRQLPENYYAYWHKLITRYSQQHPLTKGEIEAKLTALLFELGEAGHVRAKLDYANLLIQGLWGTPKDREKGLAIIEEMAQQGVSDAQLDYGLMFSNGSNGLQQNQQTAFYWYQKAAENGNRTAMYNLGLAYRFSRGVEPDINRSLDYFDASYAAGFDLAGCRIGDVFSEETSMLDWQKASKAYLTVINDHNSSQEAKASCAYGMGYAEVYQNQNVDSGIDWLNKAGQWGSASAYFMLGNVFSEQDRSPQDIQKALVFYQKALQLGSYRAAVNLGFMYEMGQGVPADDNAALKYYQIAANAKFPQGLNNLATFYRYGRAMPKDMDKAIKLYLQAFELGNDFAAANLGDIYYYGESDAADYDKACKYYEQAVKLGNDDALYDSAYCYLRGEGRDQDIPRALQMLTQSAELEDEDALAELGQLYYDGELVEQDLVKAFHFLQSAYALKSAEAAFTLGQMYEQGEGVGKDLVKSTLYYEKSAEWDYGLGMLATAKAYMQGIGTRKNTEKAKSWLLKAVSAGVQEAEVILDEL